MTGTPQATDVFRAVAIARKAARAKLPRHAAIAMSHDDIHALAQAVLALDETAKFAAGLLLCREDYRSEEAAEARETAAEMFNDACDSTAKKLAALGYVTIEHAEETSNGTE